MNHKYRFSLLFAALGLLAAGCGPSVPLSAPEWSPRGDRAAFVHYSQEQGDLYLLEPTANAAPRLIESKVERFAFSARGDILYFLRPPTADKKRGGALMSLNLYDTDPGDDAPKQLLLVEQGAALANVQVGLAGKIYLEKTGPKKDQRLLLELDTKTMKLVELPIKEKDWTLFSGSDVAAPQVLVLDRRGKDVTVLARSLTLKKQQVLGVVKGASENLTPLALATDGRSAILSAENEKGTALIVVRLVAGKGTLRSFAMPAGADKGTPVYARISADDRGLLFSALVERKDDESPWTGSWRGDLKTGKLSKLQLTRGLLVGMPGYPPRGNRKLEFTSGGLALFEAGEALPARIWPLSDAESLGGTRLFLKAGKHDIALKMVSEALRTAGPATDRARLYVLKSEVLSAAGKKEDAANAYLESLLRYPVSNLQRNDKTIAGKLSAWSRDLPEHRILELTAQAYKQRASGDLPAAARKMREAAGFSGDKAWAAGLQFGYAMNLLESGRGASAGPVFRKASEVKEFPQADWAAALCVTAYALGNRHDLAAEELQRCNDRYGKSFLASDFKALALDLRLRPGKSRTVEKITNDKGDAVRLEAWPVAAMHLSFGPEALIEGGAQRRVALVSNSLYRVVLAPRDGAQKPLLDRVPLRLSGLSFSPDGRNFAFIASHGSDSSLYAVTTRGKSLLGNLKSLVGGHLDSRTRAADYRWDEELNRPKPLQKKE